MNSQINVHITKYHSSKAAEYARIYQGCDFVVSAEYASQLESERDALQARVTSLQCLLDQRWEMMRELEVVCETKEVAKAVEYVKGLKDRVKRLEDAGDRMRILCADGDDCDAWDAAKESKP